jgi:hypothetical protein
MSHKHLGLTIVNDLTWGEHITEITAKANQRLGILRSLKYKLNRLSLERIYKSFIRPILEYGDIIWDKSPNDILDVLERVQLNAARIVVGATARCSSEGLYTETAWEPLSSRRDFHRLTMMYNIINLRAPQYLTDLVPSLVQNRTNYGLRNRGNIDPPRTRINVYTNSFFPSTIRAWNNLDIRKKSLPSIEAFKASHKRSLIQPNALYYFGGRLESAIHARMRFNNSPLKDDLCTFLHVIQSPCGSGETENAKHYFFKCGLFNDQRVVLMSNLLPFIILDSETSHLLNGIPNNKRK